LPVGDVIRAASPWPTSMKSIRSGPVARAGRASSRAAASSVPAKDSRRNRAFDNGSDGNGNDDDSDADRSHFSVSATVSPSRVGHRFSGLPAAGVGREPTEIP